MGHSSRFLIRISKLCAPVLCAASVAVVAACSDNTPPPARVYMFGSFDYGNNPAALCPVKTGPFIQIGSESGSINDGDNQSGAPVSVTCNVVSNGNGFNVIGQATLGGHGSVTFQSLNGMTAMGTQMGIKTSFSIALSGGASTFTESDCTFEYTDLNADPKSPGIASGRIWGTLTCPTITDSTQSPPHVCLGTATFRFENCGQ